MRLTDKYKNLFGNMALFTIGNFVSKLLVMLLVPFYTNVLSTKEYGIADGMQATLLLLVPLFTINIGEAALRFGIERKGQQDGVFGVLIKYTAIADICVTIACGIIYVVCANSGNIFGIYALLFAGLFICNSIYEGMILFCQGCERVKIMIIGSIACTVLVICSNLVFLLLLKIGLHGYIYSQMISFLGAAIIMYLLIDKDYKVVISNKELEKNMTKYGSSMLLYSTSSWINNALDRYFVLGMCGAAVNGLYGVAYKIPAILMVFQRIFAQAWQISANKSYDTEDGAVFFSEVYKGYQTIMVIGCSGLVMIVRVVAWLLFKKDFYGAWEIVPPLLISVIFGALTGFCGSICLAFKDGKSMGYSTFAGAIVNIILNYFLIKSFGALGAAIATMISYFVMYAFSYEMVKKHISLKVNRGIDFIAYIILVIQAFVIICNVLHWQVYEVMCFVIILAIYGKHFGGLILARIKK